MQDLVSRHCLEPGCPLFAHNGLRCSRHGAEFEAQRGRQRSHYQDPAYRRSRKTLLRSGIPCRHCGTYKNLTVDHIIPLVLGGTNDPTNLQVLCRKCNAKKGAGLETRGT